MLEYNKTVQKMIKFDDVTKEKIKQSNLNCLQIPDHPCRLLIIGGSGSEKNKFII